MVRVGSGVRFSPAAPATPTKSRVPASGAENNRHRPARTRRESAPEVGENTGRMLPARSALSAVPAHQPNVIPEQQSPRLWTGGLLQIVVSQGQSDDPKRSCTEIASKAIRQGALCRCDPPGEGSRPSQRLNAIAYPLMGHGDGCVPARSTKPEAWPASSTQSRNRGQRCPHCAPQPERWRQPRYGDVQPEVSHPV